MSKKVEAILGEERIVKKNDLAPSVVVLALLVLRENAQGQTEILLSQEKKTDELKRAGDTGWACAETSRVIEGEVEGMQSTLVSALAEEILALLGDEEVVSATYVDMGDFWYKPQVLARLATVRLEGIDDLPLGCRDGETTNLHWVDVNNLGEVNNWRRGMEDSSRIIPLLATLDYLARRNREDSDLEIVKLNFNGDTLNQIVGVRSTYPDTKNIEFAWRQNEPAIA